MCLFRKSCQTLGDFCPGILIIHPQFLFNNGGGADQQVEHCVSNLMPDLTNHFVDLVIDEIPYIACKKNPHGKNVIDRIPVSNRSGGVVEYQAPISEYFSQNYFYLVLLFQIH